MDTTVSRGSEASAAVPTMAHHWARNALFQSRDHLTAPIRPYNLMFHSRPSLGRRSNGNLRSLVKAADLLDVCRSLALEGGDNRWPMKKPRRSQEWLRLIARRARKAAKRRRNLRRHRRRSRRLDASSQRAHHHYPSSITAKSRRIEAPSTLSILENTESTLDFFGTIDYYKSKKRNIFLDMQHVEKISLDAITYLIARLRAHRRVDNVREIKGNVPNAPECANLLQNSGFYSYVETNVKVRSDQTQTLAIRSGNNVPPMVAANVVAFTRDHLGQARNVKHKEVDRILLECMSNTWEWAYEQGKGSGEWFMTALFDPKLRIVRFVFVDNGVGIPATARRRHREKVKKFLVSTDADIIYSALRGEFIRSKTGLPHRGKGLPTILNLQKSGTIDDLVVVSCGGYVDCKLETCYNMSTDFLGTLLTWTFKGTATV